MCTVLALDEEGYDFLPVCEGSGEVQPLNFNHLESPPVFSNLNPPSSFH